MRRYFQLFWHSYLGQAVLSNHPGTLQPAPTGILYDPGTISPAWLVFQFTMALMIWKLFLFSRLMSTLKTTQNWKRKNVFKGEKQGKLELLTTSSSCSFFIFLLCSYLETLITVVLPWRSGICPAARGAHHRHLTPKKPCGDPQEGRLSASRLL